MSTVRRNPVFVAAMSVCAFVVLAEGAVIGWRWWTARELTKKIAAKQQELAAMREVTPPPTREIANAIDADLARAQKSLEVMQAELKGKGPATERLRAAKVPAGRPESYFDLAQFVERMRELAKKNEVDVRAEASRFGFAEHANEAPRDEALIAPVFRQRQIAQYLLEALLEARPKALLGVKREAPLTRQQREQIAATAAGTPGVEPAADPGAAPEGADYFVISPDATVRKPGFVDATAFRFVFIGQTTALRTFLNRVGAFDLPVLVREVEVEPASAEETTPSSEEPPAAAVDATPAPAPAPSIVLSVTPNEPKPAPAAPKPPRNAPAPIVSKSISKFTVTLEYVELAPPAPAAPAETPAPPTP